MNILKKISEEHKNVFAVIITIFALPFVLLNEIWYCDNIILLELIKSTICALGMIVLLFVSLKVIGINEIGLKTKGILLGFILGVLSLILSAVAFAYNYFIFDGRKMIVPSFLTVLLFVLHLILYAALEEIVVRGLIFSNYTRGGREDNTEIISSAFLSNGIFSCAYLCLLLIVRDNMYVIIVQAFCMFLLGIYYSAIYTISKNLWSCIFIKAILYFSFSVMYLFKPEKILSAYNRINNTIILAFCFLVLPVMIIGVFMMRKYINHKNE